MTTESHDSQFKDIDQWDDMAILAAMQRGQENAAHAVSEALPALARAGAAAARCLDARAGGRLIYGGAGTPARLGVQDGTELCPTFGWPSERLAFLIAGGSQALLQAIEGAEDDRVQARADAAELAMGADDVCILISASGSTPYTLEICDCARSSGALTIAITNNADAPLLAKAAHGVFIDSGAEPVSGSTRMNAGTAQKIALNMLSTLIMIRLGHVYDGYMVDMVQTNNKLRQRARHIVSAITGASDPQAAALLKTAGDNIKLAVLLYYGLGLTQARQMLDDKRGDLRKALESISFIQS